MMKKIIVILLLLFVGFICSCGDKPVDPVDPTNPTDPVDPTPTNKDVYYDVEFVGTNMSKQSIKEGNSLAKPSEPTKTDSIFGGWYLDSSYDTEASFPMTIKSNTKVYAKFYSYEEAFQKARQKTIGDSVDGYEYQYNLTATAAVSGIASLSGNTDGSAKYNKTSNISYYDERVNSGALFADTSKYQYKQGNQIQTIVLNKDNELKKITNEVVAEDYKYDSSSFAKAIFKYDEGSLKGISKTANENEYELFTSMNFSQVLETVGGFVNSQVVMNLIGALPETDVKTNMYVTFSDGELKTYRYEMHINVSAIAFDLVYNLTFKNVGKLPTIVLKDFGGIAVSSNEVANKMNEIKGYVKAFENKTQSSYDYKVKTGIDFGSKVNEIDSVVKGYTKRKLQNSKVFFNNKVDVSTDLVNADLYKSQELSNATIVKGMLATEEVYLIEKKLIDSRNLVESYSPNRSDQYYLFDILEQVKNVNYIQTKENTKANEVEYIICIDNKDVVSILKWLNSELNLDPLQNAKVQVKAYGDFDESSVVSENIELSVTISKGALKTIEFNAEGTIKTVYTGSRDFAAQADATFDIDYKIDVTSDGNSYEPPAKAKDL